MGNSRKNEGKEMARMLGGELVAFRVTEARAGKSETKKLWYHKKLEHNHIRKLDGETFKIEFGLLPLLT